ncbi:cytochrome b [Simiduia sp. 21SJ11W-1]|uniref:cytochrome b n=1 Tax=Simiduia sp. 21SJ11W-1 TaxID=2909669 RepID=UPI00209C7FC0|nr:cytochrome b [Simiduia sp. 21SJ11W-1]UTA47621.1 cytochrome b [Simiduia sp. 21SJ11W-1]
MRDTPTGYSSLSKLLHWSSALLVLGLFGLGLWMVTLDYYSNWYNRGPALHISLGLLLMVLTLVRLLWRARNRAPEPLPTHTAWMIRAATWVKRALYMLLLAILISGYFITTAEGQPARFFDWPLLPSLFELDGRTVDAAGLLHLWGAWALIVVVAGHAGAAIFHHLYHKDATLKRMLPFTALDSRASQKAHKASAKDDSTSL